MRRVVRWLVVAVIVVHGLIHLLGAAKGLGWADVPALTEPISAVGGLAWLVAALVVTAAGVLYGARARGWWVVCAGAAVVSQALILSSWADARTGTIGNVVMLLAAAYGFARQGPGSFRATYRRRLQEIATRPHESPVVTEAHLASLPEPVAAYLRRCGTVGQPRVANFRATVHGRIRAGATKPWMSFTGEQVNTFGPNPSRFFLMDATMSGVPADVFHRYHHGHATMQAKAGSLWPIVDAHGPEMDRAETVTVFNDLCIMAPAALLDAPVTWQVLDDHQVVGTYTAPGQPVTARLIFNDDHELVDFISDDRFRTSADGKTFVRQRWSTPVREYRDLGGRRRATVGEGRWHAPAPEGEFAYLEFLVDGITFNFGARAVAGAAR